MTEKKDGSALYDVDGNKIPGSEGVMDDGELHADTMVIDPLAVMLAASFYRGIILGLVIGLVLAPAIVWLFQTLT